MRIIFLGLLLPLLAAAQQAPPGRPAQSQVQPATAEATFTAGTRLVIEKVAVKDKKGKIVNGLHKEDFTVTEDAKTPNHQILRFRKRGRCRRRFCRPRLRSPLPAILPKLTQTRNRARSPQARSTTRIAVCWRSIST